MNDRYDMMAIRRTLDGEIFRANVARLALHKLFARFVAAGQTFEILGYYPNTTPAQRIAIIRAILEAEGKNP